MIPARWFRFGRVPVTELAWPARIKITELTDNVVYDHMPFGSNNAAGRDERPFGMGLPWALPRNETTRLLTLR